MFSTEKCDLEIISKYKDSLLLQPLSEKHSVLFWSSKGKLKKIYGKGVLVYRIASRNWWIKIIWSKDFIIETESRRAFRKQWENVSTFRKSDEWKNLLEQMCPLKFLHRSVQFLRKNRINEGQIEWLFWRFKINLCWWYCETFDKKRSLK